MAPWSPVFPSSYAHRKTPVSAFLAVRMKSYEWLSCVTQAEVISQFQIRSLKRTCRQSTSLTEWPYKPCITDSIVTRWKHWEVWISNPQWTLQDQSISFYCIELLRCRGLPATVASINYSANKVRFYIHTYTYCLSQLFQVRFCNIQPKASCFLYLPFSWAKSHKNI